MRKRAPGWRAFHHVFPTRPSTEPEPRHRRKALSFCLVVGIRFHPENTRQKEKEDK